MNLKNALQSRLKYIALFFTISGCGINPKFPKNHSFIEYTKIGLFFDLKEKLDTTTAVDTLLANICFEADTIGEDDSNFIDAILDGKDYKVARRNDRKRTPCKSNSLPIGNYQQVSIIKFSDSEIISIVGKSVHDNAKYEPDLSVAKIGNNRYAYNQGHICGSMSIEYPQDSISISEFQTTKIWDSSWHVIEFSSTSLNISPKPKQQKATKGK